MSKIEAILIDMKAAGAAYAAAALAVAPTQCQAEMAARGRICALLGADLRRELDALAAPGEDTHATWVRVRPAHETRSWSEFV